MRNMVCPGAAMRTMVCPGAAMRYMEELETTHRKNLGGGGQVGFRTPVEKDHVCRAISIVSNDDKGMSEVRSLGGFSYGTEPSQGGMQRFENPGGGVTTMISWLGQSQIALHDTFRQDNIVSYDAKSHSSDGIVMHFDDIRRLPWMQYNPCPQCGTTQGHFHMAVQYNESNSSATIVSTWGGGSSASVIPIDYRPMFARKGRPRVQGATNAPSEAVIPSDRWDPKIVDLASRDILDFVRPNAMQKHSL